MAKVSVLSPDVIAKIAAGEVSVVEVTRAHLDRIQAVDDQTNKQLHGEGADQHPLPRTSAQRRHDAVVAIFLKAAGTGDAPSA